MEFNTETVGKRKTTYPFPNGIGYFLYETAPPPFKNDATCLSLDLQLSRYNVYVGVKTECLFY